MTTIRHMERRHGLVQGRTVLSWRTHYRRQRGILLELMLEDGTWRARVQKIRSNGTLQDKQVVVPFEACSIDRTTFVSSTRTIRSQADVVTDA